MGSFQQISLGVVCLVAAFMFGNYVNNHPDPSEVTTAFDKNEVDSEDAPSSLAAAPNQTIQRAAPMKELRNSSSSQLPTMKLPNLFGLANPRTSPSKLPPPSQLDQPATSQTPTAPVKMPNLLASQKRREVMVPDFSQLAAEFRNTPLELPPMQKLLGNPGNVFSNRQSSPVVDRINGETFADTPTAPPVAPRFNEDDFAPKLKERFSSNSDSQFQTNRSSTMPPVVAAPTVPPTIPADVPPTSYTVDENHNNSVRSRASEPMFSEPPNDQRTAQLEPKMVGVPPAPGSANQLGWTIPARRDAGRQSPPPTYQTAKPMIPFGLTPEAKSKLVRLRRPAQQQVDVGASRYEEHLTRPGDSLQELSTRFYGRPDFYLDIYLANQNQLRNPASLPAGIMLKIPIFE
jgi:nucleoid-associated protein YgaU